MLRSHAIICVDRNGNESRREIPARDWPDCFQRALAAEGTWRNFVRFIAADDPFKRIDRPGATPPPALGKLADAMEAAQTKGEKQNGEVKKPIKSFTDAPEIRIPRGQLATLFARMLPQMPETFTRTDLETRAFESTGERYDVGDCHNAVQFLKEKGLVQIVSRGRYRIPDDVRQGKRTLTAHVRGAPSPAIQALKNLSPHPQPPPPPPPPPTSAAPTTTTAAQPKSQETGAPKAAEPAPQKDLSWLVSALANSLLLSDTEEDEKAIERILEAIESFEVIVRRHLKAVQLRKELQAVLR